MKMAAKGLRWSDVRQSSITPGDLTVPLYVLQELPLLATDYPVKLLLFMRYLILELLRLAIETSVVVGKNQLAMKRRSNEAVSDRPLVDILGFDDCFGSYGKTSGHIESSVLPIGDCQLGPCQLGYGKDCWRKRLKSAQRTVQAHRIMSFNLILAGRLNQVSNKGRGLIKEVATGSALAHMQSPHTAGMCNRISSPLFPARLWSTWKHDGHKPALSHRRETELAYRAPGEDHNNLGSPYRSSSDLGYPGPSQFSPSSTGENGWASFSSGFSSGRPPSIPGRTQHHSSDSSDRRPYPCVFHEWYGGTDPTRYCGTFHSYVSRLTTHHRHRRHPFLYCTKCFRTDFSNDQEIVDHSDACTFRCVTEGCRNYDAAPPYANHCSHGLVNSQRFIWKKLYRLARRLGPHVVIPDPGLIDDSLPSSGSGSIPLLTASNSTPSLPQQDVYFVNTTPSDLLLPFEPPDQAAHALYQFQNLFQQLTRLATSIWHYVNREEPAWDLQSEDLRIELAASMDPTLQTAVSNTATLHNVQALQSLLHNVRTLQRLLHEYKRVLEFPEARTQEVWDRIAPLTTRLLLGEQVPRQMPWRTLQRHRSYAQAVSQQPQQAAGGMLSHRNIMGATRSNGTQAVDSDWVTQQLQQTRIHPGNEFSSAYVPGRRSFPAQGGYPQHPSNPTTRSNPQSSVYHFPQFGSPNSQTRSAPPPTIHNPNSRPTQQRSNIPPPRQPATNRPTPNPGMVDSTAAQFWRQRSWGLDPPYGNEESGNGEAADEFGRRRRRPDGTE